LFGTFGCSRNNIKFLDIKLNFMESRDAVRFSVYTSDNVRYLVLNPDEIKFPINTKSIEALCNPNYGIGANKVISHSEIPHNAKYIFEGQLSDELVRKLSTA